MSTRTEQKMKAFAVTEYKAVGDLSALKEFQVKKPSSPTGHDLLIRVKAVATNPIDYKRLGNLGNHKEPFAETQPLIVGWDASGIVEEVGDDTSLFKVGDEVMFAGDFYRPGAFAEYVLVDERIVGPKPASLTWSEAASEPLTSLTAYEALYDQLKVSSNKEENTGKTILITGGGGGVATAAIAMAKKLLGLTVIATASRDETIKYVKELGADHVINHREKLMDQMKNLGIENVDYILHTVDLSSELFTEFTELVKPFGGICSIWPSATVDLFQLFWKSINFSAILMFTRPGLKNQDSQRQHDILTQLSKLYDEDGILSSRQTQSMPLTAHNLKKALEFQASGKAVGKTTLYFKEETPRFRRINKVVARFLRRNAATTK